MAALTTLKKKKKLQIERQNFLESGISPFESVNMGQISEQKHEGWKTTGLWPRQDVSAAPGLIGML